MSKDYNLSGVHVVNRWLWQQLKTHPATTNDFVAYTAAGNPTTGLVPIIPSQQLPEFTNIVGGAPFMIYNYSLEGNDEVWESTDKMGYVIYDDNEQRLRRIHNLMVQLLKRVDWTAEDINAWIYGAGQTDATLREFDFKWVKVDNAAGPQPFESEGGRHGAVIMATASYIRDMNGSTGGLGKGMRL